MSMADNEQLLAEYKRRLSHHCELNNLVLQKLRGEVDSVKVSKQAITE